GDFASIVGGTNPTLDASPNLLGEISGAFPLIEDSQFHASILGQYNSQPLGSTSPPGISDLFYQYDAANPGVAPIPTSRADMSPGAQIRLVSSATTVAEVRPAPDPHSSDSLPYDPTNAGPVRVAASVEDRSPPITRPIVLVRLRDPERSDREALDAAADRMTKLFGEIADYKINEVIFAMKAQIRAVTGR
ncbi:MAG: hypothetical protein HY288_18495, partial [Planctomycetia bacterium]|nr:hypothetical protein [Planctomycetia bacterium]